MSSDASSFNELASVYNEVRPGYPIEVYDVISKHVEYNEHSRLLEIGAGQGIATKEIYDRWLSNITAIEPGKNLYNLMIHKFKNNSQISIVNSTFEEFASDKKYDGIFSATAFHWIDSKIKFEKTYELLNNDSFLILYWNNYGINNAELEDQIKKIYTKYGFPESNKSSDEIRNDKILQRKNEVIQSSLFDLIEHTEINNTIEYSSDSYIKLLRTFPDHSKDKIPNIEFMYKDIESILLGCNMKIDVKVIVNLEIAKKS